MPDHIGEIFGVPEVVCARAARDRWRRYAVAMSREASMRRPGTSACMPHGCARAAYWSPTTHAAARFGCQCLDETGARLAEAAYARLSRGRRQSSGVVRRSLLIGKADKVAARLALLAARLPPAVSVIARPLRAATPPTRRHHLRCPKSIGAPLAVIHEALASGPHRCRPHPGRPIRRRLPIEMVGLRALRRRCESILPGANVSPIAKSAISRLTRCSIEKWHLSAPHIEVQ